MPLVPHDHMVVHGDAEVPACLGDPLGDLDVGAAGLGAAAGVVVDQDQRRGAEVEPATDNLAGMDRGPVDRPVAHVMVVDQPVAAVEVQRVLQFCRRGARNRWCRQSKLVANWSVARGLSRSSK